LPSPLENLPEHQAWGPGGVPTLTAPVFISETRSGVSLLLLTDRSHLAEAPGNMWRVEGRRARRV